MVFMKVLTNSLKKLFFIIVGASFIFPLFWMISLSLKSKSEVYVNPFGLPKEWLFSNYTEVLSKYNIFSYFKNSLIYTGGTIILTLLLGGMLAYCLSRMRWKANKHALSFIAMGLIVPVEVVMIPLYMLIGQIGIKDTYWGLILPYSAFSLSSCVLMMYAFLRNLPTELEEAACIDGCNIYRCYFSIIIPNIKPALFIQAVLIFMRIWNEFVLALIVAGPERLRPLSVGLMSFFVSIGVSHWGLIGAAMIITSLPTIIVYLFANEQIERSLTASSMLK